MPGITNADVQYLNNGALTKTTINIRCFSKQQFQLIDVLYLRPGYTLLLEFGHSVYLDNNDKLQTFDTFSTKPLRTLLKPGSKNQFDVYREIEETRIEHSGNYDAVYGKISNFNWQFNPDGSYDCQVILTGMGDVIESLKLNVNTKDVAVAQTSDDKKEGGVLPALVANKNKTLLNQILYGLTQSTNHAKGATDFQSWKQTIPNFPKSTTSSQTISNAQFTRDNLEIKNAIFTIPGTMSDSEGHQAKQTYMTFGTLMAYIQSRFLLYNNVGDRSIPISSIDMDFNDLSKDENYILTFPGSFSADPNVCLIPYTNTNDPIPDLKIPDSGINISLHKISKFSVDDTLYLGRLAGIFVNLTYIDQVITNLTPDKDNKIAVLDFIKELLKGITKSLGGFNDISVRTTIDGKIQFIEDIPPNYGITNNDRHARFQAFGVKSGKGSFIKNVNLTAEISSDLSSMISIGAQSEGNQFSANATSFSNYNLGLEDRLIEEKSSYTSSPTTVVSASDKIKSNWETMRGKRGPLNSDPDAVNNSPTIFDNVYKEKKFTKENIQSLMNLNSTHASLVLGRLSKPNDTQQIESPFFLPFNFSLEMEGLSGMKLYQKFKISENILPPSYERGGVEIQIKGVNHSINTTAWSTKLDTLSTPAAKVYANTQIQPYDLSSSGAPTATSCDSKKDVDPGFMFDEFPILKTYVFVGINYRNKFTFRGTPLSDPQFDRLEIDGSGYKLPQKFYGVQHKLCEQLQIIGDRLQSHPTLKNITTTFSSGYRSPYHNCTIGGAAASIHMSGGAIDIVVGSSANVYAMNTFMLELMRTEKVIINGGLGHYPNKGFIHYDIADIGDDWIDLSKP